MNKHTSSFLERFPSFLSILAGVLFSLILLLLILFDSSPMSNRFGALAPNAALFPFAVILIVLGSLWKRVFYRNNQLLFKNTRRPIFLLCSAHVILFLVQWMLVRSLWFYAGWDPFCVRITAMELAQGHPLSIGGYFTVCPNNAPLTLLLTVPYWIGLKLGMVEPYILLPMCGALCINLASLFTVLCVSRLTRNRGATGLAFALSTCFILLSPFVAVPYTDAFSILFPVLSLFLWLSNLNSPVKWFLIAISTAIGTAIKASAAIFFLALLLFSGFRRLSTLPWNRKTISRLGLVLATIAIGWIPNLIFQRSACTLLAGSPVPEAQLSMSHYLMIGLNQESFGGHSQDDLEYSLSFPTLAEREQANYQRAYERLTSMSLPEAAEFFSFKLYKAYNSGTFAWNGSFLQMEVPNRTDKLSLFLRSIYYSRGKHNAAFNTVYQTVWLAVLALCASAFFLGRRQPHLSLFALVLLGVSAYQILFECWPRYLFLYAPFYVIVAVLGMKEWSGRLQTVSRGSMSSS